MPGRMQVQHLPDDRFVVVFDNMSTIGDTPEQVADFEAARQALINAGAAAVLRFDHPVDIA